MNPRYFKEQICDELEGAVDYLKKALDTFAAHPEWAEQFRDMADMEQEHATTLYKMFMELYTEEMPKAAWMESMRDGIMDCFSKYMRKIENCKATYSMMMQEEVEHAPVYAHTVSPM